jgi:cytochrome c oxidase assembly protein subunit 15
VPPGNRHYRGPNPAPFRCNQGLRVGDNCSRVSRRFARYAWTVLGFNIVVILWGALVRASKSGDGCGNNWPLCNGAVVPTAPRIATVIEFTHRLSTGAALIAVVAMAVWAFRAFGPGLIRRAAAASVFFILSEALLGAGLVLLRYVGEDASVGRALYLSAHLINTLLMLGAIALTAHWSSGGPAVRWNREGIIPKLLAIALAGALLVGVSGAIAALGDTLFPVTSLRAGWEADFSSASHLFIRLRIWHPLIATLGGIYTGVIALWIARRAPDSRPMALAVVTMVALQLTAGAVNLTLLAPIWMQMVHLLFADLLWIALVLFAATALEPCRVAERPQPAYWPSVEGGTRPLIRK